jgi:putative transposase
LYDYVRFGARGYLAVNSGNITDEMIHQHIQEQEGESIVDDSQFEIDLSKHPSTYS